MKIKGKKQIKTFKDYGKQLVESNALALKNYYDSENKFTSQEKEVHDRTVP